MPAPSPLTKPSRSLAQGRLARAGSSLRVERARMAANPPTPMGVMAASEPPAIITSASPCWMMRKESPMEWALVVQAVAVASLGPLAPKRMETCPAARLTMAAGMKNGEILRGPPSRSAVCSRSITSNPPMRSTPLLPASRPCQTAPVVLPTEQIRPMPVMTTRRSKFPGKLLARLGVLADVVDSIVHGANLLRVFVRDFDIEGLFEGHHEFDGIERIGAQVVHE